MNFLIDENLKAEMTEPFREKGFLAESVLDDDGLRGTPDEVVFKYAVERQCVIVTRDVGFAERMAFERPRPLGLVLIRYPSETSGRELLKAVRVAIGGLTEADYLDATIVLEPGLTRIRKIT